MNNQMRPETIREYMKTNYQKVGTASKITEAVAKLAISKMNNIIVVENDQPVGIVTAGDISRTKRAWGSIEGKGIRDIMNTGVIILRPDSHVGIAGIAMEESGLSVIPIVEKGRMKGVFNLNNLMNIYDQKITLDIHQDMVIIEKDMRGMIKSLFIFIEKLSRKDTLSNYEVCDLLSFQDSLVGYNKFHIKISNQLLRITYRMLVKHLGLKYGYQGEDIGGLADYLSINTSLKNIPKYDSDYIAYARIFDKAMGELTKEDFKVNLEAVLIQ